MRSSAPKGSSIADRIRGLVLVNEAGCWIWQAHVDRHGYGKITVGRRSLLVHRVSYEAARGSIPSGLTIDHSCKNTRCCNPAHLEPMTMRENALRSSRVVEQIAATACKSGHAFTASNTRIRNDTRYCRACDARRHRESKARKAGRT